MKAKEIRDIIIRKIAHYGYTGAAVDFAAEEIERNIESWTRYNWQDQETHPPTPGKYFVYRKKCDKVHFMQWNGSGWSTDNNTITDWKKVIRPKY